MTWTDHLLLAWLAAAFAIAGYVVGAHCQALETSDQAMKFDRLLNQCYERRCE